LTRLESRPETLNKSTFARDPRANDRKLGAMSGYRR
jgi:hypothetical protein